MFVQDREISREIKNIGASAESVCKCTDIGFLPDLAKSATSSLLVFIRSGPCRSDRETPI